MSVASAQRVELLAELATLPERRARLALDRRLAGCEECRWPHVHTLFGVEVGTACERDGACWVEERRRTAARRGAEEPTILVVSHDKEDDGMTRNTPPERRRVLVALPVAIKRAAHARAETSLNDEMVGVLARAYGVRFEPSGKAGSRTVNLEDDGKILLRMPPRLKALIVREAVRRESNLSDVIREKLAEEYGVPFEPRLVRSVPFGGGRRDRAVVA